MFKKNKRGFFGAVENERELLEQFYTSLNAMYLKAKKGNINFSDFEEISTRIEKLLQTEKSWRNAYQIEQLMVQIYDDETLEVELGRRLVDVKYMLSPDAAQYFDEKSKSPESEEKRAVLDRIINDLQWRYELRQLERYYHWLIRVRISIIFVLSVLVFFLPIVLARLNVIPEISLYATAMISGWFGAAFSMLIGLRNRLKESTLDDLRMQYRFVYQSSRVTIGIGAALILYFFLQADLLTGSIFPNLTNPANLGLKDNALFIIWSFLAGFSETFVPNLLTKAEGKADVKS